MTKIHCESDIENQVATISEKQCFICTYDKPIKAFKSCSTCSKEICLDCIHNLNKHDIKKCPFCKQIKDDFIIESEHNNENNNVNLQPNHLIEIRIVNRNNSELICNIDKKLNQLVYIIFGILTYIMICGIAGLGIKLLFGFNWTLGEYVFVGCIICPILYLCITFCCFIKNVIKYNLIDSELITEY